MIPNKHFKKNGVFEFLTWLMDFLVYELPPGPACIPLYFIVNLNKGTMMIYLLGLMIYYDNWSLGAWIYVALHGNYGIIWTLKDRVFPDIGFERKQTLTSLIATFVCVLLPYYCIGFWHISSTEEKNRNPSLERIFCAIQLYCLGVVLMVLTDG